MDKIKFQTLLNRLTAAKIIETNKVQKELFAELETMKDLTEGQRAVFLSALLIEYGRMEQEKQN